MYKKTDKNNGYGSAGTDDCAGAKHVLVMALSSFPGSFSKKEEERKRIRLKKTIYVYKNKPGNKEERKDDPVKKNKENPVQGMMADYDAGEPEEYVFEGYYQLDPIPLFIRDTLHEYVTDVVLMETKEIREKIVTILNDEADAPDGSGPGDWTVKDYFHRRIKKVFGEGTVIHDLAIDEMDGADALKQVMGIIRELYETVEDKSKWRLWMDTHGAFRDISMVLASAARFFATDKKSPIDTSGIFSVYHSQDPKYPDRIVDQTAFYFSDSAEALQNFLNYGQYLAVRYRPYEGEESHGFVSYRHDRDLLLYVRNIFARFMKNGVRFWYDDGIRYRDNWKEKLEYENKYADAFIGLLSNSYFESPECWKELVRAIAYRRERDDADKDLLHDPPHPLPEVQAFGGKIKSDHASEWERFHFILLEKNVAFPDMIPVSMPEVRTLAGNLHVTDQDIRDCLEGGNSVQWFQWFMYMEEGHSVDPKNLSDEEIDRTFRKIGQSIRDLRKN